jgi:signal peptidase I
VSSTNDVLTGYEIVGPSPPKMRRWLRITLIVLACVVALVVSVVVLLRLFVLQVFTVPSNSMSPAIPMGATVIVDRLSYDLHGVHRGDIVVFRTPAAENCGGSRPGDLIKRIVGLPGERISLAKGNVLINGKKLNESWLDRGESGTTNTGPPGAAYSLTNQYVIPPDRYFVLGDLRQDSCDSRYWGPISKSLIVGRVDLVVSHWHSIRLI